MEPGFAPAPGGPGDQNNPESRVSPPTPAGQRCPGSSAAGRRGAAQEAEQTLGAQLKAQASPHLRQVMDPPSHLIGCQREVLEGPQVPETKQV